MKAFVLAILCLFSSQLIFAQDIIILNNGKEIVAKVLEVKGDAVSYKSFKHQDGPVLSLAKKEVFLIKYASGSNELLYPSSPRKASSIPPSNQQEAPPAAKEKSHPSLGNSTSNYSPNKKKAHKTYSSKHHHADNTPPPPSYVKSDLALFGGVSIPITSGDVVNIGGQLGVENAFYLSPSFGLVGQMAISYNSYDFGDYYYELNGGEINTLAMSGIRLGHIRSRISFYGSILVGADWAIPTGDFGDANSIFAFVIGGSIGLVFNQKLEIGIRPYFAPETGGGLLGVHMGFHL